MRIMKYVLALVFALGMAIPSFAVELSLGGFPSFMRFRWRSLHNATFHNILTPGELENLGGGLDADTTGEHIHFADMTLRLTPQLVLSDAVTIRASIDVLSNAIAGGATGGLFGEDSDGDKAGGVVQDDLRYTDRFNGTLLFGDEAVDANYGSFSVKYLHADINLGDKGFVRIGRQPFDFAMGLYANGGHDPYSDAGFNIDRLLWLKGYSTALGATTVVLVSDYIGGGSDSSTGSDNGASTDNFTVFEGSGETVDYLAAAVIINNGNLTYGAYYFPYIEQNNMTFGGAALEWDMALALYSAYAEYKTSDYRFITEYTGAYGELSPRNGDQLTVTRNNYVAAARLELFNTAPFTQVSFEAGISPGDQRNTAEQNGWEGSIIRGNGAYQLDNLLFKHVIPTLYNRSGSIINAKYLKADVDYAIGNGDNLNLAVLMAWVENKDPGDNNIGANAGGSDGVAGKIGGYYGTEYEAVYTMNLVDGVELSLIGSYIDVGDGLSDALIAQAYNATGTGVENLRAASLLDTEDAIWGFQSRLMIFIDDFFKAPAATK